MIVGENLESINEEITDFSVIKITFKDKDN